MASVMLVAHVFIGRRRPLPAYRIPYGSPSGLVAGSGAGVSRVRSLTVDDGQGSVRSNMSAEVSRMFGRPVHTGICGSPTALHIALREWLIV